MTTFDVGGQAQAITDKGVRRRVRAALARHVGFDIPAALDGAA